MNKNRIETRTTRRKSLAHLLERIGLELVYLRMEKGYDSIKDFAANYDLPLIQYWRIEKGKANVTLKSLVKLLTIHHVAVEDFFCRLKEIK